MPVFCSVLRLPPCFVVWGLFCFFVFVFRIRIRMRARARAACLDRVPSPRAQGMLGPREAQLSAIAIGLARISSVLNAHRPAIPNSFYLLSIETFDIVSDIS